MIFKTVSSPCRAAFPFGIKIDIRTTSKCISYVQHYFSSILRSDLKNRAGAQQKCVNKNLGATFIFRDRMFGTFQPEDEQVAYGLTHNIEEKASLLALNLHEYRDMCQDIRSTHGLRRRVLYLR